MTGLCGFARAAHCRCRAAGVSNRGAALGLTLRLSRVLSRVPAFRATALVRLGQGIRVRHSNETHRGESWANLFGIISDDTTVYRISASKGLVTSDEETGAWVTVVAE